MSLLVESLGRGAFRQTIAGTGYTASLQGSKFIVFRGLTQVGHVSITVQGTTLHVGKLAVIEAYRKSGISTLIIFFALMYGVLNGATSITLNEDSEVTAIGFWARYSIQPTAGQEVELNTVLNSFERSQDELAQHLGLARSPRTMLLSVDYPAAVASRPRRGSFG